MEVIKNKWFQLALMALAVYFVFPIFNWGLISQLVVVGVAAIITLTRD